MICDKLPGYPDVINCRLKKDTLSQIIFQETSSRYGEHDIRRLRAYMFTILHSRELKLFPGGHVWSARRVDIRECLDTHIHTYIFRSSNLYFL